MSFFILLISTLDVLVLVFFRILLLRCIYTRRFNFLTNAFYVFDLGLHFYLGLKNEPWFGPAGSENNRVFGMCKAWLRHLFKCAFTACGCVFKVITLVGWNQWIFFENATTCSKHIQKMLVATQLKLRVVTQLYRDWNF